MPVRHARQDVEIDLAACIASGNRAPVDPVGEGVDTGRDFRSEVRVSRFRNVRSGVVACVATILASGALIARDAQAKAADEPLALMFIAPAGDSHSRGFLALLVAAYSKRAGLVLLEGAERDRIQAEIDLSKSGMVAEDSQVRDRRIKPDVTVEVRLLDVGKPPPIRLDVVAQGPAGREAFTVTLASSQEADLLAAFDEPIARTVPEGRRGLFLRGCLHDAWALADPQGDRCVDDVLARCRREAAGRDLLVCVGRQAAEVRKRVLAARDDPADATPEERALVARLKQDPKGSFSDADRRLLEGMAKRSQQRKEDLRKALDRFRERIAEVMGGLLAPEFRVISFSDQSIETFRLTGAGFTGVRWSAHEASPSFQMTVKFTAPDRRWTRNDFGTIRKFVDQLRSFGLKGTGPHGEVFDIRLMTSEAHRAAGSVDTVISTDFFARMTSISPYEPMYRTESESD